MNHSGGGGTSRLHHIIGDPESRQYEDTTSLQISGTTEQSESTANSSLDLSPNFGNTILTHAPAQAALFAVKIPLQHPYELVQSNHQKIGLYPSYHPVEQTRGVFVEDSGDDAIGSNSNSSAVVASSSIHIHVNPGINSTANNSNNNIPLTHPPPLINAEPSKEAYEQQQDQDNKHLIDSTSKLCHANTTAEYGPPPPDLIPVSVITSSTAEIKGWTDSTASVSTYHPSHHHNHHHPAVQVPTVGGGYHAVHLKTEPTDAATQRLWHADGQSIINIQESGIASITSLQTPSPWLVPPNSVPQPPPPPGVGAGGESYQHVVGESSGIAGMGPGGIDRFQTMSSSIPGMNGE